MSKDSSSTKDADVDNDHGFLMEVVRQRSMMRHDTSSMPDHNDCIELEKGTTEPENKGDRHEVGKTISPHSNAQDDQGFGGTINDKAKSQGCTVACHGTDAPQNWKARGNEEGGLNGATLVAPPHHRGDGVFQSSSQPGAHYLRGPNMYNSESDDVDSNTTIEEAHHHHQDTNSDHDGALAVAYPAEQVRGQAVPVGGQSRRPSSQETHQRKASSQRRLSRLVLAAGLVAVLVIAMVAGLVSRNQSKEISKEESGVVSHNSGNYSSLPSSPTEASLEDDPLGRFHQSLPDFTIKSLKDATSPQRRAYYWLEKHRDVAILPDWRKTQLFALVTFYYAFQGPHWPTAISSHWLDDSKHECYWFSSNQGTFQEDTNSFVEGQDVFINTKTCNNTKGVYAELILMELDIDGLSPTIPPEISLLEDLEYLLLYYNGADGTLESFIPNEIVQLKRLVHFGCIGNQLSGAIPTKLASLPSLVGLYASNNALTGNVPNEIYEMESLITLWLGNNLLTGSIPGSLLLSGGMPGMDEFIADNNQLHGTIPTEFGVKSGMVTLRLNGNPIIGTIPSELGTLSLLNELGLAKMPMLTGTIPLEVAALAEPTGLLGIVDLAQSVGITGEIPVALCHLQEPHCAFHYPWYEEAFNCSLSFDCSPLYQEALCGCNCPCT